MRYTRLDGLRGLLSLMVALNHSFMILAIPTLANIWGQNIFLYTNLQSKLQQVFMLIGNGGLAVSIFFVLSGFVLFESAKNWQYSIPRILAFYIKRFLRLYPVYLMLVILSALYMWTGFNHITYAAASSWFHWWMNFDMTLFELLLNITFIHTYLGGVTWTLRVIMLASLLFPLMGIISKQINTIGYIVLLIVLIWASFTYLDLPNFNDLRFLYMFFLGGLIPRFKKVFETIPPYVIFVVVLPLLLFVLNFRYQNEIRMSGLVESLFSFVIIGLLAFNQNKIFEFFDHQIMKFLGKISYSLYLTHFSVLYIFSKIVLEKISPATLTANYFLSHTIIFVFTTLIAIGLSSLVYKVVEEPFQTLSQKIR